MITSGDVSVLWTRRRRGWDQRLVEVARISAERVRLMRKSVCQSLFTHEVGSGCDVGVLGDVYTARRIDELFG